MNLPEDPRQENEEPTATKPGRPPASKVLTRLLVTVLLLAVAVALWVAWSLSPVSSTSETVEFEVLPGWGAGQVAHALEQEDLVRNATLFTLYLRVRGFDRSIGEGLYDLDRSAGALRIAERLVEGGRPRTAQIVFPEGGRGSELAQRLEEAGLGEAGEYTALIERPPEELRPSYLPDDATLEGYLFPASYEIPLRESPREVLARFLERFERELTDEVLAQLEEIGFSVHEWVTFASMVQSEAGGDEEMTRIAGVFFNRLDLDMLLQSDPTVAYGLGKSLPELDPGAGDMRADHPWNTYTRRGLPEGPISNPGHAALHAVLEPERTGANGEEYLYFLHGFDEGEPVFRLNTDLQGHNEDVDRYLR